MSALEFALILPVMLTLLFGIPEFGRAIDCYYKVAILARTVADLTAQGDGQNTISSSSMSDIVAAAKLAMAPYGDAGTKIVVSAMGVPLTGGTQQPRVCSSYASGNATARSIGMASDLTIPAGFQIPGTRYVHAEVTTVYVPLFGTGIMRFVGDANNQYTFRANVPWPVRGGKTYYTGANNEIVLPAGSPCPANS